MGYLTFSIWEFWAARGCSRMGSEGLSCLVSLLGGAADGQLLLQGAELP